MSCGSIFGGSSGPPEMCQCVIACSVLVRSSAKVRSSPYIYTLFLARVKAVLSSWACAWFPGKGKSPKPGRTPVSARKIYSISLSAPYPNSPGIQYSVQDQNAWQNNKYISIFTMQVVYGCSRKWCSQCIDIPRLANIYMVPYMLFSTIHRRAARRYVKWGWEGSLNLSQDKSLASYASLGHLP